MPADGINLVTQSSLAAAERAADGSITLRLTAGGEERAEAGYDCLIFAVGRRPLTARLGLSAAGVETTAAGGHIVVDEFQNTTVPGVYALGDVCV